MDTDINVVRVAKAAAAVACDVCRTASNNLEARTLDPRTLLVALESANKAAVALLAVASQLPVQFKNK